MATGMDAKLEDELQEKSDGFMLPKARELQELSEEYLAGVKDHLLAWLRRKIAERQADVALSAKLHEHNLARAELGVVARRYIEQHTGTETRLAAGIGHDLDYRDTEPMSRLLLMLLTKTKLWLAMIGTALGVLAAGALDYGMVSHLIREGSRGALGEYLGTPFELVTTSLATVVVYTLMSMTWGKHPLRRVAVVVLYGFAFSWLAHYASKGMDEDVSLLAQWALPGLKTAVYTMPGLLLCVLEHWLCVWVKLTCKYHVAARIVAEADQLLADGRDQETVQDERALADLVDHAMRCSLERAHSIYTTHHATAQEVQSTIGTAEIDQHRAETQRVRAANGLANVEDFLRHAPASLMLLLGLGLSLGLAGCGTEAQPQPSPQEILAKAGSLVMGVDQSLSSPALNAAWLASTFPYIVDERVKALVLGSRLSVVGMGDMSKVQAEDNTRVQFRASKTGIMKNKALPWAHDRLLTLAKPAQPFMKSELVAGVCEAAKLLNPQAEQSELLLLTDGIEESAYADCRKTACKLPPPPCRLPGNASVTMVGVGIGLDGRRGASLQGEWRNFFVKAGVEPGRINIRH